jgi:hypothetical protein
MPPAVREWRALPYPYPSPPNVMSAEASLETLSDVIFAAPTTTTIYYLLSVLLPRHQLSTSSTTTTTTISCTSSTMCSMPTPRSERLDDVKRPVLRRLKVTPLQSVVQKKSRHIYK